MGEERGEGRADAARGEAGGYGGARETRLTRSPDSRPPSWLARQGAELGYTDLERDEKVFVQQAAELRQAIKDSRRQIEESLGELQRDTEEIRTRALDAFDLNRWAREHPWRLVGVAAAIGFYIGFRE